MGVEIKRNESGEYKLISTISDEQIHTENWVDETEAKRILIERLFLRFIDDAAQIEMDFPLKYHVNGEYQNSQPSKYHEWAIDKVNGGFNPEVYQAKMIEIMNLLNFSVKNEEI